MNRELGKQVMFPEAVWWKKERERFCIRSTVEKKQCPKRKAQLHKKNLSVLEHSPTSLFKTGKFISFKDY